MDIHHFQLEKTSQDLTPSFSFDGTSISLSDHKDALDILDEETTPLETRMDQLSQEVGDIKHEIQLHRTSPKRKEIVCSAYMTRLHETLDTHGHAIVNGEFSLHEVKHFIRYKASPNRLYAFRRIRLTGRQFLKENQDTSSTGTMYFEPVYKYRCEYLECTKPEELKSSICWFDPTKSNTEWIEPVFDTYTPIYDCVTQQRNYHTSRTLHKTQLHKIARLAIGSAILIFKKNHLNQSGMYRHPGTKGKHGKAKRFTNTEFIRDLLQTTFYDFDFDGKNDRKEWEKFKKYYLTPTLEEWTRKSHTKTSVSRYDLSWESTIKNPILIHSVNVLSGANYGGSMSWYFFVVQNPTASRKKQKRGMSPVVIYGNVSGEEVSEDEEEEEESSMPTYAVPMPEWDEQEDEEDTYKTKKKTRSKNGVQLQLPSESEEEEDAPESEETSEQDEKDEDED